MIIGLVGGPAGSVLVGSIIGSLLSPVTSTCKSLFNNLIGICGGPIAVREAYMDGCLKEFLDACFDLIRHLMGG